jgi:hypothetical protein
MPQYIAVIPRDAGGDMAVRHLRSPAANGFGVRYITSLVQRLKDWPLGTSVELRSASILQELPYQFHLIETNTTDDDADLQRLMLWHSGGSGPDRGKIEAIELNAVPTVASGVGLGFQTNATHVRYMQSMNIRGGQASATLGRTIRIGVIDTGAVGLGFLHDFFDVTNHNKPIHPGAPKQIDSDGHGTAMATLINQIAPKQKSSAFAR